MEIGEIIEINTKDDIDETEGESTGDSSQKERKLTSDSGFGDEVIDNLSSLQSTTKKGDDKTFSVVNKNIKRRILAEPSGLSKSLEDLLIGGSSDLPGSQYDKLKQKRQRRVTPIPRGTPIFKPSKGGNCEKFISLEEEDDSDVEQFSTEEDYIYPYIRTLKNRHLPKRNSWHGITAENAAAYVNYDIALLAKSRSKSLEYFSAKYRKKESEEMNTITCCQDDTNYTYTNNKIDTDFDFDEGKSTCCTLADMNSQSSPRSPSDTDTPDNEDENDADSSDVSNLPLWMKEAEAEMTTSDSGSGFSGDENIPSIEDDYDQAMLKKLDIPIIDWRKLSDDKNKSNILLSNQRKQLMKDKQRPTSRRRKITPSGAPSTSTLAELNTIKCKSFAQEWTLTEEDEMEEEEYE